jgi:hypothetical protein
VKRAQLAGTPVLLGSATPIPGVPRERSRAGATTTPAAPHGPAASCRSCRPSTCAACRCRQVSARRCSLLAARHGHQRGEQALLFLNRRGYRTDAPVPRLRLGRRLRALRCTADRAPAPAQLRCHHCGRATPCPTPARLRWTPAADPGTGHGTGRGNPRRELPCPVHRIDSDAMRGREAAALLRPRGARRALRAARHADADQGPPLSRGAAGRHHRRGCAAVQRRFSRRGAPRAADRAGRRPCRARATAAVGCCCRPTTRTRAVRELRPAATRRWRRRMLASGAGRPAARWAQLCLLRCDCRVERERRAVPGALRRAARRPLPRGAPHRSAAVDRCRAAPVAFAGSCGASAQLARGATAACPGGDGRSLPRPRRLNWFIDVDAQDVLLVAAYPLVAATHTIWPRRDETG